VADNNIYRWAGMLLSEAGKLLVARPCAERQPTATYVEAGQLVAVG
jgi:hypothetical protein